MKRTALQVLGIMIMITLTSFTSRSFAAGHTVTISSTNATCFAMCNGTASATVSGGVGPFSYAWNPSGATTATATGLCAGAYTVTVTDNNDMSTATATVTINQPTALSVSGTSSPSCYASCTGSTTSMVSGGTSPYAYLWNNNMTTPTASGLCPGTYTIMVTDANGCVGTNTVTVGQSPSMNPTISPSPASICQGSSTTLTASGIGATTFIWSPAASLNTATGATVIATPTVTTTYSVTMTNGAGCSETTSITIIVNPLPGDTASSNSPVCPGSALSLSGTSFFAVSYNWVGPNGFTSTLQNPVIPSATALNAGTYTLTVTDPNGCTNTATTVVTVHPSTGLSVNPPSATVCQNISVIATASSSVSATYMWYPFNFSGPTNILGGSTTTYTVVATDVNGCTESITVPITVNPNPTASATFTPASCSGSDGTATVAITGGTGPYSISWTTTPPQTTVTATGLSAGADSAYVVDANGCVDTAWVNVIDSCGSVWPGDANEDLTADNNDVLTIGLAYNYAGYTRQNATLGWTPQPAADWGITLTTGADAKYADCNGDGVVDNNDTTAISLNYGNTHPFRLAAPEILTTNPNIYLVANADSVGLQTLITVDVMMGTSAMPIDSIYGVAFTLSFDPSLVDSTMTSMDFTGSWIGTAGVNMLPFWKGMHAAGNVDVAVVGTDHQNRIGGQGKIATLRIVTTDNLSGLSVLPVNISNVNALRLSGNTIQLNPVGDSIVVDPTGIRTIDIGKLVSLYPNPAASSATLVMPASINGTIHIVDLTGRNIMSIDQPSAITHIDLSQVPAGMYQVIIQTPHGNVNRKLNVIR